MTTSPSPVISQPLATQSPIPQIPVDLPRPTQKPRLLTEYEFETMWDPDLRTLRLGVLLPFNAPAVGPTPALVRHGLTAIRLAVEDVNKQKIIPGINMSIIVRDSQEPSLYSKTGGSAAIAGAGRLISAKVAGVIGDIRSDLTRYEALMTSSVRIPHCSYASDNPALSNRDEYSYFYRTIPTSLVLIDAVLSVVKSMGWKRIYLIRDSEYLGWIDYFYKAADRMGIYIVAQETLATPGVTPDASFQSVKNTLRSSHARVQVVIAPSITQYNLVREMKNSGYFGPEYAWVTTNNIGPLLQQEKDVKAYDGLIMVDIGWDLQDYGPFQEFRSRWQKLDPTEYPGAGTTALHNDEGMAYSCVLMLANAYGELVKRTLPDSKDHVPENSFIREVVAGDYTDSIRMSETYSNSAYEGPAGPISLDKNGDRKDGYYVAQTMSKGKTIQFGFFIRGNFTFTDRPFPSPPNDAPRSALQNPQWSSSAGIACGVLSMIVILMILISAILVLHFRNHIVIKASSTAICITNSFILTLGVTLLTGSLTIKSYRIYRIFNSVNFAHQTFQTRLLLRYMGLIVLLCLVTPIIEMAIDAPQPATLNVGSIQWVRCRGYHSQMWWSISASIVPAILLLFGVFFAIKTRNVMFLWNEARQITLVLYNIFFFAILVIASQFFPYDIYLATYYITLVGTYVVATLALLILFVPKFRSICKSRQKSWGHGDRQNEDHNDHNAANTSDRVRARVAAMTRIPANISAGAGRLRQTVIDKDTLMRSNRVEQNPLYAWMGSQMPHRGSVMTLTDAEQQQLPVNGRLIPRQSEDAESSRESTFQPWKRRYCGQNAARPGVEESVDAVGDCMESEIANQLMDIEWTREQGLGDSDSGIQGKLDSYVCTNGHSTSYLMHSMAQEKDELVHPTLRVITCHTAESAAVVGSGSSLHPLATIYSNPAQIEKDENDTSNLDAHPPSRGQPTAGTTNFSGGLNDESDEEADDLYDPEFGIGVGIGRRKRRQQSRSISLSARGTAATSSGTSATIPSAAVISAAAAAVMEAPRKSFARRKITSNADRYTERDEEVTEAEELDQGIDRQTIAFREMLKDSDQRKTFDPAAYFRFKSEKEVESQDAMEDSQQARKLLEVRLDDIETALMTLSLKDRLYLRDSDVRALDRDMVGKVSLTTGKPIVPKLVRGQAASDILIKPSTPVSGNTASSAAMTPSYSKAASGSIEPNTHASMDADLDELLDITKSYGRDRVPTPAAAGGPSSSFGKISTHVAASEKSSPGNKTRLPPPLSKGSKTSDVKGPPTTHGKGLPPLRKAPPARPVGKKDEEWLDSVLGM
ncbi:hypothetical protein BGZ68_009354 [Mortierella alpina]|nr:hypothetical protein BGZ68_009354 [Mortierella alpina]